MNRIAVEMNRYTHSKWLVNFMQMVQTAESFQNRKDDCFESIYIPFNRFL